MSGTSMDGVDGALVDFNCSPPSVVAFASADIPPPLKRTLFALNSSGPDELHQGALAANALVRLYSDVVGRLLSEAGTHQSNVRAIGAHGQTVRHRPQQFDQTGYTLQLNQPALLAELSNIDVVADFRSRDIAAGGQGAPLVPPFHQFFFGGLQGKVAVLNIGGISNITLLPSVTGGSLTGFDCGPGNALMDYWCHKNNGAPFDNGGAWAARGDVNTRLLESLLAEPYFKKAPPKSTGRDLFNPDWLERKLAGFETVQAVDVQATLTELTAVSCARSAPPTCETLVICGGGAFNLSLLARLRHWHPTCQIQTSDQFGLPPLQVEATAFAWLAKMAVEGKVASDASVTGASGARILGAIYQA
jgi:anhydro-N-acetylmuramic acid kinase